MGIAYLTALGASLLVSLTLSPVLCSYFLKGELKEHADTKFVTWLKRIDRSILNWALPNHNLVLVGSFLVFILSLLLLPLWEEIFFLSSTKGLPWSL